VKSVIHEWPDYLAEIFRVTAPGGRLQLTEMSMRLTSQTGSLGKDSGLKVMERAMQKHAAFNRFDLEIGPKLSNLVEQAGFHSVEEKVVEVPIGGWQSGQKFNEPRL
jgi:ubiquinone/menaquinone biosynthesis C-methylase UbiE